MSERVSEQQTADAPEAAESEFSIGDLLLVLRRQRWVALAVLVLCVVGGVLYTMRQPRIYEAHAKVLLRQKTPQVLGKEVGEVYNLGPASYWAAQEYANTQKSVIESRGIAEKVVARLGLEPKALAEQVRNATADAAPERGNVVASLPGPLAKKLSLLGIHAAESRAGLVERLESMDAAGAIKGRVSAQSMGETQILKLVVKSRDPQSAATLANAVASTYVDHNLEQRATVTSDAAGWLGDQVLELRQKLEASEDALHQFKDENNIVSVSLEDRRSMTAQTLEHLNKKLSEVRTDLIELGSRRAQIEEALEAGLSGESLTKVLSSSIVSSLKSTYSDLKRKKAELTVRYTEGHPKVAALQQQIESTRKDLKTEIDTILRNLENQYQAKALTKARLEAEFDEVKAEAIELNKKAITYKRLKRERDNNESLYQQVLKRQKEADLSRLLKVNNVQTLEAALPPGAPVSPNARMNIILATLMGLLGGVAVAFAIDYLDNSIKSRTDIEQLLGLHFLGLIPAIKEGKSAQLVNAPERDHYIIAHPRSSVAESCRSIRTSLLFMTHHRSARRILISSPGPQEGKTTTVVNLAVTMAQSGARTVIVDTDMRRPRLHKSFGLDNTVGVSNYIVEQARGDEIIQPTGIDNLDVIPCGPLPPNPAELLHTDSFERLVRELGERYDRVLFDSPPLAAVADGLVLASLTDGAVLVLRQGETSRHAAKPVVQQLRAVGTHVFGAVLNGIDLNDRDSGEYYQYYYRSDYGEEPDGKKGALSA